MHKILTAFVATMLLAGGGLLAAAPAHASTPAPKCNGDGCYKLDPIWANCGYDASTPNFSSGGSRQTPYGLIEIRYSLACHANWAKVSGAPVGDWFWVENRDTRGYLYESQAYSVPSGYSEGWTNMVDGYLQARACVDGVNATGTIYCTNWE
jgi:hypothetical protein